jgi:hypothetical protein
MMDERLHTIASEILTKKNEIIDLFCKTFIVSQEPKSIEELKWIFENFELETIIHSNFSQTFRLKFREKFDSENYKMPKNARKLQDLQ